MARPAKLALLAATVAPIGYFALFYHFIAAHMTAVPLADSTQSAAWMHQFNLFFTLNAVWVLWIMGLLVYYLVHLYRTPRVPDSRRAFWAVLLFMGNLVAMPVYWYLYVWREPALPTAA